MLFRSGGSALLRGPSTDVQRLLVDTSRIPVPLQRSASRESQHSSIGGSRPSSRPASAVGHRRGSLASNRSGSGALAARLMAQSGQQQDGANGAWPPQQKMMPSSVESAQQEPSKNLRARSVFSSPSPGNKVPPPAGIRRRMAESATTTPHQQNGLQLQQRTPSTGQRDLTNSLSVGPSYPRARGLVAVGGKPAAIGGRK